MTIPFLDLKSPCLELKDELDAAYRHVMESGWYILGKKVEAFENEFAAYCEAKHCIGEPDPLFGTASPDRQRPSSLLSCLMPKVWVGTRRSVATHSLVKKDIETDTVVGGVPAKKLLDNRQG